MEGQEPSASMSTNVLKMLQMMEKVVFEQTDRRLQKKLDLNGQIPYSCKVNNVFTVETQEFISKYFRSGDKRMHGLRVI
jgi:hypothetical protein